MKQSIFLQGMQGLGDNIHQRAIVRHYMKEFNVYLETPWPSVFHDLVPRGLKLTRREMPIKLRTQALNAARESHLFVKCPQDTPGKRIWYNHEGIRRLGFLGAMCEFSGAPLASADYRLPIAPAWRRAADKLIATWKATKPILLYRPLVERTEWNGCKARNPDFLAYATLFNSIRSRFFVVSLADLAPGKEWIAGYRVPADVTYHAGELHFPVMAAITERAAMVYASPGFMMILAQAVKTPSIVIFGGHESSRLYRDGMKYAPFLGIDPIKPCECFDKTHACRKQIDLTKATRQIKEFCNDVTKNLAIGDRPVSNRLAGNPAPIYESGRA